MSGVKSPIFFDRMLELAGGGPTLSSFNRPDLAGAVLQTPLWFNNSVILLFIILKTLSIPNNKKSRPTPLHFMETAENLIADLIAQ